MDFRKRLQQGLLLGDGAMGTMLQKMGLKGGEAPELWNLEHPDRVRAVSEAYVAAGAETVITNTFGGSSIKLAQFGLENRAAELNARGAELARQAAGEAAFVAGSVGPTGQFLEPYGTLTDEELYRSFAEQVKALEEGGADFIQVETMSDLSEARIAVVAALENTGLPVVVSMTFERGPRGYFTIMGIAPQTVVETFAPLDVAALGTNCGNGIDEIIEIVAEFKKHTSLPIFAAPNAGQPELKNGAIMYTQGPEYFARRLPDLLRAGATFVAGCCGTTPDHIREMARVIRQFKEQHEQDFPNSKEE